MWVEIIAAFLGLSLLFYCLFGGADFGAAILESFLDKKDREKQKEIISHAIGPVWEANHVWLILAVVILFNGFPRAYSLLSTFYYIPLTLMLVGITLRGCAFTFRHYDAVKDGSQKIYSLIFRVSGWMVPLTLGMMAGGTLIGQQGSPDFVSSYLHPWLNPFSFLVGVFTCALFAFLAAIYLIGETPHPPLQKRFAVLAQRFNLAAIAAGSLIFITAQWMGFHFLTLFFSKPLSVISMALATVILMPLWKALKARRILASRGLAAAQILFVLVGWFGLRFPVLFTTPTGEVVTFYNAAAPEITLKYLFLALAAGCLSIFPSLFYLFKVFKKNGRG